jgi:S1-C subfamily serine protease
MRAIAIAVGFLWAGLCLPAAAQQRAPIRTAYVVISADPLDIASDLTQYFTSRGISARTYTSAAFNELRRAEPSDSSTGVSRGSAFFVDDNGTLVTNYHVIEGRPNIIASVPGGNRLPASVLSSSPAMDVAVLAIRGYRPDRYLDLASTTASPVGGRILAIGYPLSDVLGAGAKVTDGIVSSLSGVGDDASRMQVSVPIQPGNSGGPVVLPDGRAVGIAVSSLGEAYAIRRYGAVPQNVNFAIRMDFARPLFSQFMRVTDPSRKASNIEQAMAATVPIEASAAPGAHRSPAGQAGSSRAGGREVVARFRYDTNSNRYYQWLASLEISVEDLDSGELVARFAWSGMTWTVKRHVVARAIRDLDQDLGLAPVRTR